MKFDQSLTGEIGKLIIAHQIRRRVKMKKTLFVFLTAIMAITLLVSCGKQSAASFLAAEVTDTGGIDDRSFNASAWRGLQDVNKSKGIQIQYLQSTNQSDYVPNIQQFIQKKAGIIVTVGFLMGDDTQNAAKANPNQKFAIVDYAYDPPLANVLALTFQTDEAAFLGGYLAAAMTKTGKVGTFGGMNIPTVTIFMNGFAAGVRYYNQKNGAKVQVLGWDAETAQGTFTNDFTNQAKGKTVTETLMNQGADVVLPVAGSVGLGAAAAVQQHNAATPASPVYMEWVDSDGYIFAPQYGSLFLTSVMKQIDISVRDAAVAALGGSFKGGNYVGTLKNGGVAIAPYHDFDSKIPANVKTDIETIKQGIIDGKISVDPKSYK
jgi:basic membrane protein A